MVDLERVQRQSLFERLLLQTREDVGPFSLHSTERQVLGVLESVGIRAPIDGRCNQPNCLRFEVEGRPLYPRVRTERW